MKYSEKCTIQKGKIYKYLCMRTYGSAKRWFHHTGAYERVELGPKLEIQPTWRCVKCEPAGHSLEKNRATFQPCLPGWEIVFNIPQPAYQARYIPGHTGTPHTHTHTSNRSHRVSLSPKYRHVRCTHVHVQMIMQHFQSSVFLIKL